MQSGSIRLFRVLGIDVFLHFSWFLVAVYQLTARDHGYSHVIWAVYEYVALFAVVLLHEFGHALACRQVGGEANRIMLWPLGGIAFVRPPPRPGAELWSIAAGPLVNVALLPVFVALHFVAARSAWLITAPDAYRLVRMVEFINLGLLVFNLLPIYPLDGGQILRSLLWFPLGRILSLKIATVIGFIGGAAVGALALWQSSIWFGILALFLLSQAAAGRRHAQALALQATELEHARTAAERPPML